MVLALAVVVGVVGAGVIVDRSFIDPAADPLVHADAVVVLGGAGDRAGLADRLVRAGYTSVVVTSIVYLPDPCPASVPGRVTNICFHPDPVSTQGEARAAGALIRSHHWSRVLVVSGRAQATRARIRVARCTTAAVAVEPIAAPVDRMQRWVAIAYEVAATAKAELWQRSC